MFGSFWDIGWVDTRVKRFPFPLSFLDIARVVSNFRKCVLWGVLTYFESDVWLVHGSTFGKD